MFKFAKIALLSIICGGLFSTTAVKADEMQQYKVEVKTGGARWAATRAHVYATLYGNNPWSHTENLTSSPRTLLSLPDHVDFGRNSDDTYVINSYDLENVYAVRLEHDNTGKHPAWYLESVKVTEPRGKTWTFTCNCWVDKHGGLDKVLYADKFVPPGV